MENEKDYIRQSVDLLKRNGVIRYDSDIAKALKYSRGAVSELLNPESGKPMTYTFTKKFKDVFGKYLEDIKETSRKDKENESIADRVLTLEIMFKVLKESMVTLISQTSGKHPALVSAELDEAIHILKKKP